MEITVYCKTFKVEKFHGFHRSIGNRKTFPVKHPVQIGFGYTKLLSNHEYFPANYSLVNCKTFPPQTI